MRMQTPPLTTQGRSWQAQVVGYLVPILAALVVAGFLIFYLGENPLEVYRLLLWGAVGNLTNLISTLRWATPLILAGLAVTFAYRSGLFNMGAEGQIFMGAFVGALAGIYLDGLGIFHMPIALLASALGGGLFALIPAWLRVYQGVNEIVTTLMLDYVALFLTNYLVKTYFLPGGQATRALEISTERIAPSAAIPLLAPPHPLNAGLYLAIVLCILVYLFFRYTVWGYRMTVVGASESFAQYGGIPTKRIGLLAFVISGMIAGLAGGIEVLGTSHRFIAGFATGLGQSGILVVLLGKAHPIGVIFAGLFYGALKNGSFVLERMTSVDRNVAIVLQATIILFMSGQVVVEFLMNWVQTRQNKREVVFSHDNCPGSAQGV
jgi:ABC-type uncharacterized transport system permease subunit